MAEHHSNRVTVWLLKPKDRPTFMLQWIDPETGDRKSRSSRTTKRREAEQRRTDLEYEINNKMHREPSAMPWGDFWALYLDEQVEAFKPSAQVKAVSVFNGFTTRIEPKRLADVNERSLSRYVRIRREEKKSVHTIRGDLSYLHAMLKWAKDQKMIDVVPVFPKVKAPKKRAKGRPVTTEEFERMLEHCPNEQWRNLLTGLWLSGMRLSEALDLWWDREDKQHLDFTGDHPMIVIPAETEKGGRDRRIPLPLEFAEFLEGLPGDRTGRVFGFTCTKNFVGEGISAIGKAAMVKVHTYSGGKVKFASAHDFRRSFGTRWARLLMPAELMLLMRHSDVNTTMRYYVDLPADDLAVKMRSVTQQFTQQLEIPAETPVEADDATALVENEL